MAGKKKGSLRILFAGDFCPIGRPGDLIRQGRADEVFGDMLPQLHDADLAITNLECPLSLRGRPIAKSGPNLRAHPGTVNGLTAAGFTIANMANNHIADFGPRPIADTLTLLKKNGIYSVGAGMDLAAAQKPLYIKRKGRTLAFLAFAENEFTCADRDRAGAWPLDPLDNIPRIRAAAARADICIVMIHGGNEYNPVPNPRMIQMYRAFADAGAAAVIGTHPHVPQGFEIHNDVPIFYSLGNFVFDMPSKFPLWWQSFAVRISFEGTKAGDIAVIPHRTDPATGRLALLKGRAFNRFIDYLSNLAAILEDEDEIAQYWDGWCALMGPGFVNYLQAPAIPWRNRAERKAFMATRNILKCEAHHALLSNYLELVRTGRIGRVRRYIGRIKTLQKSRVPRY